jgi:uncharacterized membrane protein (UPF0127 family)
MLFLLGILVLSPAVFYKDIFLFINESALPEVSEKSVEDSSVTVEISNKTIQIELADTPALRTLGLSGRDSLAPDHGMLFVFEKPDRYGFWMKEMNFSIDIIWIDASKKIVHIEERVSPESYPKIYIPDAQALFVLEVPAGFVTENKIRVGDEVKF